MNTLKELAEYYKRCLYEEAKLSTLITDLATNPSAELLALTETEPVNNDTLIAPKHVQDMVNMQVKAKLCKDKQLIYVCGIITDDSSNAKVPFIYGDCEVDGERIKLNTSSLTLNIPALLSYAKDEVYRDAVTERLLNLNIPFPCTEQFIKQVHDIMQSIPTSTKLNIHNEQLLVLASINKGLAGVINELTILSKPKEVSSFYPMPLSTFINTGSNYTDILADISRSGKNVHAITGGPGTGKSTLISQYALSEIGNGHSVLICSKSNTAVDVLYNKLARVLQAHNVVRTGGKEYNNKLAENIEFLCERAYVQDRHFINTGSRKQELLRQIDLINQLHDLKVECDAADTVSEPPEYLPKFLHKVWSDHETKKRSKRLYKIDVKCVDISSSIRPGWSNLGLISDYVSEHVRESLTDPKLRTELLYFAKKLKKGLPVTEINFQTLLNVFPVWCTTVTEISDNIPLISNLFDVVIIDEASQCDIATALPVLYRARKVIVVGDNKQLKFMSFLPNSIHDVLYHNLSITQHKLCYNYKDNSLFDLASVFSPKSYYLDKQFRGCNEIMEFSRKTFYNSLISPAHSTLTAVNEPIVVSRVDGKINKNGVNEAEVERVIKLIKHYAEDTLSEDEHKIKTIGVLSPFRDQVKAIQQAISKKIPTEIINKYNITVGTAHSFQGEERDLMILSWVVTDNSPIQQYTFINNKNLFNVAVTRADKQVINLISATEIPNGLLKSYIEYCTRVNSEDKERVDE